MSRSLRAIRGATTLEVDTRDQMIARVTELVGQMFQRNAIDSDEVVSILFTATDDLHCMFPAEAARTLGIADIPLMCARELDIDGATPRCVRVLAHVQSTLSRAEIEHVYLHDASALRPDLARG